MRVLLACGVFCLGCAADGGSNGTGGDAAAGDSNAGDTTVRPPGDASGDRFNECVGVTETAEEALRPVDIIFVVDSSNSMENDARAVQDNLDAFATFIAGTRIDFHLVLISDRGFVTPSPRFMSDPMNFLFIDRSVGSEDVFARALDQFPNYSMFLRPDAATHIVGITDDNDNISGAPFVAMMEGLLGHPFTFHAIASEAVDPGIPLAPDIPCRRSGGLLPAADIGSRYYDAADLTMGQKFSICADDWSALFTTLAMTVAIPDPIECTYPLPDPPAGMVFASDQVNVEHTPEGGSMSLFPRANSEGDCGPTPAWYYDNNTTPTQILLCPSACDLVNMGPGQVDVRFGCETELI